MAVTPEEIKRVMSALGSRTSERKAKSSAANGRKGGRPRTKSKKVSTIKHTK